MPGERSQEAAPALAQVIELFCVISGGRVPPTASDRDQRARRICGSGGGIINAIR
jgi:hypothetical protein